MNNMSEDELKKYHHFKIKTSDGIELDLIETKYYEELLDLYQQKCKQNKDAKDYIEYYLLDNMSIEGNAENTHKELKKLYNMLGGDNLR